ncbi:uncharacterized protein LOC111358136 [Spodoptera litura]|uniref:Uncharacterized protein LOC111358136 n=1 Tax=Spodoptera litura TaxID=69820 RepID=A0A9J7EHL1_SPOLT|nr:uncharacterized protein LOC111358136 [Spodoptera litura]
MEPANQEPLTKKGKRPKSATKYPKRMPTYVVAFEMQELHDAPFNPHQITQIHNVDSTNSISPSSSNNSTKTFTITPTENSSRVLDIPIISEVKIDILDENQCGDMEKRSPQLSSYILVGNRLADEKPEIIFNATKHGKRCKDSNKLPRKKLKKNKHIAKFKNIHFKYKNPKKNIRRRLKKYYRKAKMGSRAISKVVSRSLLKKVLAKENLLDECDDDCICDGDDSLNSSPSTTKKSFISYASHKTLRPISSTSSRADDFNSIKTVNSVIQVSSDIITSNSDSTPYHTNIIDLAVAVTFSGTKPNDNQFIANSCETIIMHKENLTSDEMFLQPDISLTSKPPSQQNNFKIEISNLSPTDQNEDNMSHDTLIGERTSVLVSSDENFVIARTSSDFNKLSITSNYTYTSNSDTTLRNETLPPDLPTKEELARRTAILDKVINLGYYPVITPSTSSDANIKLNDVIVTDNLKRYPKNKGDEVEIDLHTNMLKLKKSYEIEKLTCLQKNISLPNDITIKAKIKESEKSQKRSCADEVRVKYPTDMNDMWERLTLVLDLAVKRLEETLAEKIVNDIKRLSVFNQNESKILKLDNQMDSSTLTQINCERPTPHMVHKEVFVAQNILKEDIDGSVQCNLVQNQVIDQLMFKLSIEGPKPVSDVSIKKLKKTEIVKDYFEILKPPATASVAMEAGRGDIVTVSTATEEIYASEKICRLKGMLNASMTFLRENMFIITSVPTFFIVMLCFYGIIVITLKTW